MVSVTYGDCNTIEFRVYKNFNLQWFLTHKIDERPLLNCKVNVIASESGALVKEFLKFGEGRIGQNPFSISESEFRHGMNTEARIIKCELTVFDREGNERHVIYGQIKGFRFYRYIVFYCKTISKTEFMK